MAKRKKIRGRLVHLCSLPVPKSFDPLGTLSLWWCRENEIKWDFISSTKKINKSNIFECSSFGKSKNKLKFGWEFNVNGKGNPSLQVRSRDSGACSCCALFFPHGSGVGPGSKDLVTAPIAGLRSLNNNTIELLRRRKWASRPGWRWKCLAAARTWERFHGLENG